MINYESGRDAVFLPGKIHGCEEQVYIISYNDQANNCQGSWDIAVVDKERIISLFKETSGNADEFFERLPDLFQGEWFYCDKGTPGYDEYCTAYAEADFVEGRDGTMQDEMNFLAAWASS